MTENENSAERQTGELDQRRQSARARLLPKVTFGLSAAVLALAVVVAVPIAPSAVGAAGQRVMTTVGLDAVINSVVSSPQTTCCGEK